MPPGQDESPSAAYLPTSLDFINLPNPIEPHTGSQKHPLNGTPRLEKARLDAASNQELFNLILDFSHDHSTKRVKYSENLHLDLPKLPVRSSTKRLRIPPTLSGLHHPPPNAGILPSINTEQPQIPLPKPLETRPSEAAPSSPPPRTIEEQKPDRAEPPKPLPQVSSNGGTSLAPGVLSGTQGKRAKRKKWSDEETEYLLRGVARFGIGSWTKIVNFPDYKFNQRTALDLKDRFRVCCPEHYRSKGSGKDPAIASGTASDTENRTSAKLKTSTKGPPTERVSALKLKELGIDKPFTKTGRRARHGYTEAEDQALLKGFKKYGVSWSTIRQDEGLGLADRKPTDLRDRFRTRFPDEYSEAGLALRSEKYSAVSKIVAQRALDSVGGSDIEQLPDPPRSATMKTAASQTAPTISEIINKEDAISTKQIGSKKAPQPMLISLDELFLGVPLGTDEDGEAQPIVLDRGILDWATTEDANKTTLTETLKNRGIDPLMTLSLPKPNLSLTAPVSAPSQAGPSSNTTSLPSLTMLIPDDTVNPNQLELPLLAQWYGPLDNEIKTGGNTIPSLEELIGSGFN